MATSSKNIGSFPLEVLDVIFSFCTVEDIRNFRLVNHHWQNAASIQVQKRICLNLKAVNRKEPKYTVVQKIGSLKSGVNYPNVQICKNVPKIFETRFADTLVALKLMETIFSNVEDCRRVVLQAFGSLKELEMINVVLPKKSCMAVSVVLQSERIPKVKKLVIKRFVGMDQRRGMDVFEIMDLHEVVRCFANSLKEFTVWDAKGRKPRAGDETVFTTLKSSNTSLVLLSYGNILCVEDVTALRSYLASHGHQLKHIHIRQDDNFLDNMWEWRGVPFSGLEFLQVGTRPWSFWGGTEELTELKSIRLKQYKETSLGFLERMPGLEIVHIDQMLAEYSNLGRPTQYLCETVHTVHLTNFNGNGLDEYRDRLPNVRTLSIEAQDEGYFYDARIFFRFTYLWPNLLHLKLTGFFNKPLSVCKSNNNGNENRSEYVYLLRLRCLRSFTHNDEDSLRVHYGDWSATEVFLKMPALRTLEIGSCAMSSAVVDQLRDKLMVFTYKQCVRV